MLKGGSWVITTLGAKNDNNNDITYYYVLQLHNSINVINSYSNWTDKKTT